MKKLIIILLLSCIGLSYALSQTPETVIVFGDNELYYSPAKKEIWFYKSNSFESDCDRGIKHIYGSYVTKNKSLNVHWKEESTFWEIDYENYAILSFDLPNNKNHDRVLLDSTAMWISYNGKEKNKIPFDEVIVILEQIFEDWNYEAKQLGPFYFPKTKNRKHFGKWYQSSYSQNFGFFYPEDLKNWAEKKEEKQKDSTLIADNEEIYRLPIHWNGRYLYLEITNSPLKQTFSSTSTCWDWRDAWNLFNKREWKEKKQRKIIKKFFKENEVD